MSLFRAIISNTMAFSRKKPTAVLAIVFAVLFTTVLWIFLSAISLPRTEYNFAGEKYHVTLEPGKPLKQAFIAQQDGLDTIKIAITGASLSYGNSILFELADSSCKQAIISDRYGFFSSEPAPFHIFTFPRIADSNGKTYCFKATYFYQEGTSIDHPSMTVMEHETFKNESYTNAATKETYQGQSLSILPTYTENSLGGTISNLSHRMSQYKPWFFKDAVLAALLIMFLIGTIAITTLFILL